MSGHVLVVLVVMVVVMTVVVVLARHEATVPAGPYDALPVILDGHNDLALRVWLGQEPGTSTSSSARGRVRGRPLRALGGRAAPRAPVRRGALLAAARRAVPHEKAVLDVEGQLAALEGLDVEIVRRVDDSSRDASTRSSISRVPRRSRPTSPISSTGTSAGSARWGSCGRRPNAFGRGCRSGSRRTRDTGGGLTRPGEDLVHACNLLGIMVDVSHLNEAGFCDVARLTQAPIVATHSNVHALCASSRNLTDSQLDAIGESGGVVGINFATTVPARGRPRRDRCAARADRAAHRLHRVEDRRRARRVRVGLRGRRDAG